MNYKNNMFILRNIHKPNDEELVDYTFKILLPEIYNYYKQHRNTNEIIYNINNCYKKYFPNLYLELLWVYNLSDLTKLIYRKNNYNKIDYIIKSLKEKNVKLENYREEAKNILSTENIKNYSSYIDEKYLNKERIKKYVLIVINIIIVVKNHSKNFSEKIYYMKNLKKP